jgi:hypothetical protein
MVYLIQKQHVVDGEVVHTVTGFTKSEEDANTLNAAFNANMGQWLIDNKDELEAGTIHPKEYFDSNPDFHYVTGRKKSVKGLDLIEITDINSLL